MTWNTIAQAVCMVAFIGAFIVAAYAMIELSVRWEHRVRDEHTVERRADRWTT